MNAGPRFLWTFGWVLLGVLLPGVLQELHVQNFRPMMKRQTAALTEFGNWKEDSCSSSHLMKGSYNEHKSDVEKVFTYLHLAALCRLWSQRARSPTWTGAADVMSKRSFFWCAGTRGCQNSLQPLRNASQVPWGPPVQPERSPDI